MEAVVFIPVSKDSFKPKVFSRFCTWDGVSLDVWTDWE